MDSATRSPLENVSISIRNSPYGGLTNEEGRFRISLDKQAGQISFTITGYRSVTMALTGEPVQHLTVLLSKAYTQLKDVIVSGKRGKYRNKNNPAVELIRQVISNKEKNGPAAYPYLSYQKYEKSRILADKPFEKITHNGLLRKYRFLFENVDTTTVPGKSLSSIYLREVLSKNYYRRQPEKNKQVILARKSVDYGEYVDMNGIAQGIDRLYEDINIYDNTIPLFATQFLSPVANVAPGFYMYYIRDTIEENGVNLVKLYFTPRNPEDLLFRGNLYITLDGNYAIRRVELSVARHVNLNWARDLSISQDFEKGPGERYHLAMSDMGAWFSLFPQTTGVYGERTIRITQMTDSVLPDSAFRGPRVDTVFQALHEPDPILADDRPVPLSQPEAKTYRNTDSLIHMRSYQRLMDWLTFLSVGYKSAGKFEIGPVGSFYAFNPVEGQRFRFGGRSNTRLSKLFFTEDYLAFGTRDRQWKYSLSGTYSINHRSIYTYPFHYVQLSYLHDTQNPGQENEFSEGNSFLSSFARGYNSKWLYSNVARLSYVHEFGDHLSYDVGMKYWKQQPTGTLYYVHQPVGGSPDTIPQITTSELSVSLRWAPHETFFQNKAARTGIINKYPIMDLQYAKGITGLFGGQYGYDAFHFSIFKRWYVAPFGYTDMYINMGYLGGRLPFPLLIIHPANTSYFYSGLSYNLMNTEEFVSDHFAGMNIDHYFNGFFLNKIPLLKRLRLREVVAMKLLFGGLRKENDPMYNADQLIFPTTNGAVSTFTLQGTPYFEASVGIDNIFSFIRVDLVKRFTYLDNPGISTLGLRFSSNFHF
jgi:hypothetical protein